MSLQVERRLQHSVADGRSATLWNRIIPFLAVGCAGGPLVREWQKRKKKKVARKGDGGWCGGCGGEGAGLLGEILQVPTFVWHGRGFLTLLLCLSCTLSRFVGMAHGGR